MPQTQFKATGITDANSESIQDAGMKIDGVNWVNVNSDNIVLTHDEGFDVSIFEDTVKATDASVELSQS